MTDRHGRRPGLAAEVYDRVTQVLSLAMVVIGLTLAARFTPLSILLGLLFFAAGTGRLYAGARIRRLRRRREEENP